jgi:ligand-binding sensor domain-containing protein
LDLSFKFDCPDNLILHDFQFDDNGSIWLATDEGLLKIEETKGEYKDVYKVDIKGLNANDPVRALAFVDSYLCFANAQGLVIYKDDDYILFTQDSGLPSKILQERGLMLDKDENLLVATAKGLAYISKDAIQFRRTSVPQIKTLSVN